MRHLYALLVGIDEYPDPRARLKGCVNDITEMETYLQGRTDPDKLKLRTLKNEEATRQAIIDGFREHLCQAQSDDVVLFCYSGHGSQELAPPEFWEFEPDRKNETFVCYDSRTDGGWDLADKELRLLIAEVAEKDPHVVIVLDCCHSGLGTREELLARHASRHGRQRPLDSYIFTPEQLQSLGKTLSKQGRHVSLAACRDSELAKEKSFAGGKQGGIFSHFLRNTLIETNGTLTYRDLFKHVEARVRANVDNQSPLLDAIQTSDLDRPFLGGAIVERASYFTVSYRKLGANNDDESLWMLDGGAVHGIPGPEGNESTILALFSLDAQPNDLRDLSKAVGEAKVDEVWPETSYLQILEPDTLDTTRTFKAVVTRLPSPPIGVLLKGELEGITLVRDALARSAPGGQPSLYVQEVQEMQSAPQLQLSAQDREYLITRPGETRPLVASIPGYHQESADQAAKRLEHISRWIKTKDLRNPNSEIRANAIKMSVISNRSKHESDDLLLEYGYQNQDRNRSRRGRRRRGRSSNWQEPKYKIKLKNKSNQRLYCAVLSLSESFAISVPYFPTGGVWLEPGEESFSDEVEAYIPEELLRAGVTERRNILKVIVSTNEFDATLLEQSKLDEPRTRSAKHDAPIRQSTLNRLMSWTQRREVRKASKDEYYDDWTTSQMVITVRRPRDTTRVPNDGADVSLGANVTLAPHETLVAQARLSSVPLATRGLGKRPLPSIFLDDSAPTPPFHFTASRGADPGLSVLELSNVADHTVVTSEAPLRLNVASTLPRDERVLAFGFDGEFHLPLGYAKAVDGQTQIELQRLPAPVSEGTRNLGGSIRIFFRKIISEPLGREFEYPILAVAEVEVDADNKLKLRREKELAKVKARVAQAERIVLYVHGFTGKTDAMAQSTKFTLPSYSDPSNTSDLALTFDYESLNTPIEEIARSLKQRLEAVGLGPNHGKKLQIVAHSMGGVVSRWFIEREGGNKVAQRLTMVGSPNAGVPWSKLEDWATFGLGVALNGLSTVTWPAGALSGLLAAIEKADVTLDQLNPNSDVFKALNASDDPQIPYVQIAGNTSLIPGSLKEESDKKPSLVKRLLQRLDPWQRAYNLTTVTAFLGQANDLIISQSSMKQIPKRSPRLKVESVKCDHITYFNTKVGRKVLRNVLESGW